MRDNSASDAPAVGLISDLSRHPEVPLEPSVELVVELLKSPEHTRNVQGRTILEVWCNRGDPAAESALCDVVEALAGKPGEAMAIYNLPKRSVAPRVLACVRQALLSDDVHVREAACLEVQVLLARFAVEKARLVREGGLQSPPESVHGQPLLQLDSDSWRTVVEEAALMCVFLEAMEKEGARDRSSANDCIRITGAIADDDVVDGVLAHASRSPDERGFSASVALAIKRSASMSEAVKRISALPASSSNLSTLRDRYTKLFDRVAQREGFQPKGK